MKKTAIWIYPFAIMGVFLMLTSSCKKDDNKNKPILTTTIVSNITQTTASCGGNITSDGGVAITARGVCWSTSETPTIADNKTIDSTGTGSFSSNITGLIANTTYYVCAYAVNSAGTGYGSTISFTTLQGIGETVTDIDGNVYHTMKIGNQFWMIENLKVTHYRNGDAIQNVKDDAAWEDLSIGAYCDYENNVSNSLTYGRLYNWSAVSDGRSICPSGWHVPTNEEWNILTNLLGGDEVAAGKLKEAGTAHWLSPNEGATNETGFTALPGGSRETDGSFSYLGLSGDWWSSTLFMPEVAWERYLDYSSPGVYTHGNAIRCGFSVRCVKD